MTVQDSNSFPSREELIKTAVQFLLNPKVAQSPLGQKREFLKRKGLTEEEIDQACSLAFSNSKGELNTFRKNDGSLAIPMPQSHGYPYYQTSVYQPTLLQKVKEFFNVTTMVAATLYAAYWFYKKFIEPFLFGSKKKDPKPDVDQIIQDSMREMRDSILKVECDVQKLTQSHVTDTTIPQLVQELKQDLASLKALLLSRKQFPSAPASIPPWQLDASSSGQEKAPEREDDAGSGSSTHNSDSSLEMIREDPPKE